MTGWRCGRCSTFPARNTDRVRRGRSQPRTRPCPAIAAATLSIAHTSKYVVRRAISCSPGTTTRPAVPGSTVAHPTGPKKPIVSFFRQYRCR